MTLQELFDGGLERVVKQGGPSVDHAGFCMYRGTGGRKCHIGVFIDDSQYNRDMEGDIIELPEFILARFRPIGERAMQDFQSVHDKPSRAINFFRSYREEMEVFASKNGLNTARLAELLPPGGPLESSAA